MVVDEKRKAADFKEYILILNAFGNVLRTENHPNVFTIICFNDNKCNLGLGYLH